MDARRGAEGLAAFPQTRELVIPGLSASRNAPPLLLVRPWSGVLRADIDRYARSVKLSYVEDESNRSPKYLRNRIRREVVPLLDKIRPGFRQAAARAVSLTAEAAEVLRSVSLDDLARCRDEANPHALRIPALLRLIPARQAWCLRTWMQEEGMQLPSRARLEEGLRQVRQSHADSQLALQVRSKEMRRWGDLLVIRDVSPRRSEDTRDAVLVWEGGDTLALPGWNGSLAVIPCLPGECGVSARRLRDGTLEVRARRGAERMKLWPNRPSKYLKDLFAEAGRARLRTRRPSARLARRGARLHGRARHGHPLLRRTRPRRHARALRIQVRSESARSARGQAQSRRQARFGASRRALRTFFPLLPEQAMPVDFFSLLL